MTEDQYKYQTLMENQRHNLEIEKIQGLDAQSRKRSVDMDEVLLPYRGAEILTKGVSNLASAFASEAKGIESAFKAGTSVAKLFM